MHYMAFVITDVTTDVRPNTGTEPPTSDILEAAHQAVQIAVRHIEHRDDSDANYPESLDTGHIYTGSGTRPPPGELQRSHHAGAQTTARRSPPGMDTHPAGTGPIPGPRTHATGDAVPTAC